MAKVVFNDVVLTLEVQPHSEQYGTPRTQIVLGNYGVYVTICRRACAYAGLTRGELTIRRIQMAKSGRRKKSALRRQIALEIANGKARSDRSAISLAVPSRRAPLSPLASVPLFVTPTKPVKVEGGKRKGATVTKKIKRLLSKGHVLEPEEATAFRALSARGNDLAADRPDIGYSAKELCREFGPTNQN